MKKIALLVLAAAAAAGCTTESTGTLSLTWGITLNGAPSSCAAVNARTVEVTSIPASGASTKVDLFDCTDLGGETAPLRTGTYTVKVRLLDANNQQLNIFTPTTTFAVAQNATTPIGNFLFAFNTQSTQGTLSLTWAITKNGVQTTCGAVNGKTVELTSIPQAGSTKVDLYDCTDFAGESDPLTAGIYTVKVRLLDPGNNQLNIFTPTAQFNVVGDQTTPIGNFQFAF
jgi:hypothetical protein